MQALDVFIGRTSEFMLREHWLILFMQFLSLVASKVSNGFHWLRNSFTIFSIMYIDKSLVR